MVALDKENLLFNVLSIVVRAALIHLNSFFENVEFILIAASLGEVLKKLPKVPQGTCRNDDVPEVAANVPRDEIEG